jgi:hypothetical protein
MQKMKITKSYLIAFACGILATFVIKIIIDWKENIAAFHGGYKNGLNTESTK